MSNMQPVYLYYVAHDLTSEKQDKEIIYSTNNYFIRCHINILFSHILHHSQYNILLIPKYKQ
jgi:hypothetical protein